jgi:hypothetical protein
MKKSNIANGQMFIYFDKTYMDAPQVWVKVGNQKFGNHRGEDEEEVSQFVDNQAIVQISIGAKKNINIHEKFYITDPYYGKMVREGKFVPIDDLNEVENICEQNGWPFYEIELGF